MPRGTPAVRKEACKQRPPARRGKTSRPVVHETLTPCRRAAPVVPVTTPRVRACEKRHPKSQEAPTINLAKQPARWPGGGAILGEEEEVRAHEEVDVVVQVALSLYSEVLHAFRGRQKARGGAWPDACQTAEEAAAARYPRLLEAVELLLPRVGAQQFWEERGACPPHTVLELRGRDVVVPCQGGDARPGNSSEAEAPSELARRLAQHRADGPEGRARDALCAVLAAMASRREMCWLEAYDAEQPERGYFAHALVSPRSTLRIALTGPVPRARPASLLVTSRLCLREALASTDSGGPLKDLPENLGQGAQMSTLQLGLQELDDSDSLGVDGSLPEERMLAQDIVPEPRLAELLLSGADVLAVEAYVALAPRDLAAAEGVSEVVQAELELLLRVAKAQGVAVVLQLGGSNPHRLAAKVYRRAAFAQHGLRCGYLRWRLSPEAPWARELPFKSRPSLAIQLP